MNEKQLTNEEFTDALVRLHEELSQSDFTPDPTTEESRGAVSSQLASAKRVIELLAKAKPLRQQITDTAIENPSETPSQKFQSAEYHRSEDIPSRIGRFEVRSLLGAGGFGVVFLAYDPNLSREVAIKVPQLSSLLDSDAQTRFNREGRALAALNHPGIVPIYEVGNEGPIAYIASEYVPGMNAAELIGTQGAIDSGIAARMIHDLAEAIQHAHGRGVIHRDLKPANVLLQFNPSDANDARGLSNEALRDIPVRVADFGLAKLLQDTDEDVTRAGSIIGTPAFAAPEQLRDNGSDAATVTADVYSLGALLYYLVTGVAPFQSNNVANLIRDVQNSPPLPLNKFNTDTPDDLSAICLKCLEKTPADRYATANELGQDLSRFLAGEPVQARPLSLFHRSLRWCSRNRALSLLATVSVTAVLGALVATSLMAVYAKGAADDARRQYLESKRTIDDYFVKVSENPVLMSPPFESARSELLESALVHYQAFVEDNKVEEELIAEFARTHMRLGDASFGRGDLGAAEATYEKAIDLIGPALGTQRSKPELRMLKAACQIRLGGILLSREDLVNAEAVLKKSIAELKDLQGESSDAAKELNMELIKELVGGLQKLIATQHSQDNFDGMNATSNELLEFLEAANQRTLLSPVLRNHLSMALGSNAMAARRNNELERSREQFRKALQISEELMRDYPAATWFATTAANTFSSRANLNVASGELANAEENFRKAARLVDGLAAVDKSPRFRDLRISIKSNLASLLSWRENDLESLLTLRSVIPISRELAEEFPDVPEYRQTLIHVTHTLSSQLAQVWQIDEAMVLANEVRGMLDAETVDGSTNQKIARLNVLNIATLGRLALFDRRFEDSRALWDRSLQLLQPLVDLRPDDPQIRAELSIVLENRAFALSQLGLHELAILDRRRALELTQGEHVPMQQLFLADVLARNGETEEARRMIALATESWNADSNVSAGEQMQCAFAFAALAVNGLSKGQDGDSEQVTKDLEKATSALQNSVAASYFRKKPYRIESINMRDDLQSFFELPEIKVILEPQRKLWENQN